MHYDVIIIGGGPGGTTAAKELAAGGKKVAIIEDKHWGGTCLNCGCIPTKTLKASAEALETALRLAEFGITCEGTPRVDPAAVLARNSIKKVEVVDFPELGMEAVRKIYVEDFPAFIIVDDKGNDFFAEFKK